MERGRRGQRRASAAMLPRRWRWRPRRAAPRPCRGLPGGAGPPSVPTPASPSLAVLCRRRAAICAVVTVVSGWAGGGTGRRAGGRTGGRAGSGEWQTVWSLSSPCGKRQPRLPSGLPSPSPSPPRCFCHDVCGSPGEPSRSHGRRGSDVAAEGEWAGGWAGECRVGAVASGSAQSGAPSALDGRQPLVHTDPPPHLLPSEIPPLRFGSSRQPPLPSLPRSPPRGPPTPPSQPPAKRSFRRCFYRTRRGGYPRPAPSLVARNGGKGLLLPVSGQPSACGIDHRAGTRLHLAGVARAAASARVGFLQQGARGAGVGVGRGEGRGKAVTQGHRPSPSPKCQEWSRDWGQRRTGGVGCRLPNRLG